jgi:membrane fusion protein, multidrug efflux system
VRASRVARSAGLIRRSTLTEGNDAATGGDAAEPKRDAKAEPKRASALRKPAVPVSSGIAVVVLIVAGILFWLHERRFESTDDAFVDARVVRVAPQIAGRVVRVLVNDNQLVKVGQPLVEIDPGDVQARLDEAVAQEALAEAEYQQAQTQVRSAEAAHAQAVSVVSGAAAQAENAARDYRRYTSLQKTNPLAVAQAQLDQAATLARNTSAQENAARQQAVSSEAAIAAARAQEAGAAARIKTLSAQVQQARLNFGYAKVIAPVDGHVSQRKVAVGTYVDPGQQMMAIVPLQMWVTANYKETQLAHMRPGQPVDISIDACPNADAQGHVDSIQRGSGQAFALLPPENATGNYVKVVQRVPVKIVFETVPRNCPLGPGLSVEPKVTVR